jgi:hypothetical protein
VQKYDIFVDSAHVRRYVRALLRRAKHDAKTLRGNLEMYNALKKHKWSYLITLVLGIGIFLYEGIFSFNYTALDQFFHSMDPLDSFLRWVLSAYVGSLALTLKDLLVEMYKKHKEKKNGK